jgi:molybdate transport system substrate-binding protein
MRHPASIAIRSLRSLLGVLLLFTCLVAGCEEKAAPVPGKASAIPAAKSQTLTVLAAASLADAFKEIGAAFEASHPGAKVEFSFAGSNQLRTQLENGAKGDVFASADHKQMDAASASKVVDPATIRTFAVNRLALIVPRENRAKIADFQDLSRPGLRIVVADKAVPVGNYTRLMLEKADPAFAKAFDANTASKEENVAAVVAKVALGEADAGIAYASDAAGSNASKLTVLSVPPELDQRAEYLIATTAHPADAALARAFIDAVVSPAGQATLKKYGYSNPADSSSGKP